MANKRRWVAVVLLVLLAPAARAETVRIARQFGICTCR